MSIFTKALNAIGLEIKGAGLTLASGVVSSAFGVFNIGGTKVAKDRALNQFNSWSYAAIRAIAEEIGRMQFKLYKVKKDGTREEVKNHEILDLLYGVNPFQTSYEHLYTTAAHLEAVGNSYWLLDGVDSDTGKPKNLFTISPKYIRPIPAPLPEFVKGYEYTMDGVTKTFKPYQILHLKYPDPNNPYEGIGTIQAIAPWIDADNAATAVNSSYFKNGARLGGLLESETAITDGQMKVMRASFEALYKGAENSYKVGVLPKGVKYKEASTTPKDMDFAVMSDKMRDKILAGFRVPRTALGITDDVNRANAEATNYVFALRTIKPKMEMIVQYLNEFLVPRYGSDLYLDFESPVPEDVEARMKQLTAATGNAAIMSVNEAREEYFGLPPISNGDSVMTSFQSIPLGEPEKSKDVKPAQVKNWKMPSTRFAKIARVRKSMSEEIADRIVKALEENNKKTKEIQTKALKSMKDVSEDDYEVIYKAFAARVTPYEKQMTEVIRKYNKKQKDEVLANLPDKAKSIKAPLFDKARYIGLLIDFATPILTDLFEKEGKEAGNLVGLVDFTITPEAKKALDHGISLMAESYTETSLKLIEAALTQGQTEGLSLDELTGRIAQVYEASDGYRAAQVARTETFRIANSSTKEAWKQTGVVKSIKWYTAADERVCEWCGPIHGKVIGIEEDFFVKGDTVEGSDGTPLQIDYDDVGVPPLHVSCRCYSRPEDISTD